MQGAPTAISRNPVAEGLGQAEVTHLDSLLDVMQTKVNAKFKIVGFYKELPVLATGWVLTVETPLLREGKLGAGSQGGSGYGCWDQRYVAFPFPGLRWFGNECLNAANLNPFPALFLIHGLWSCKADGAVRWCLPPGDSSSTSGAQCWHRRPGRLSGGF